MNCIELNFRILTSGSKVKGRKLYAIKESIQLGKVMKMQENNKYTHYSSWVLG